MRAEASAKLAYALVLVACAAGAARSERPRTAREPAAIEWPARWDDGLLRPLAPSDVERRFAARFPGALARFADGERQLVMRAVDAPTRMLHPAADCYRASGYRVAAMRVERDAQGRDWRCFDASRDARVLRVCERIADSDGRAWTDTSAWFWAALSGRTRGPWLAVTTAQPR